MENVDFFNTNFYWLKRDGCGNAFLLHFYLLDGNF